jgi:hypothetical protein
MTKKRRKNPKGRMPPALARYWRERRRKSNPRAKRRRNPVHLQHVLFAQRQGGPVLKYLGGIKFSTRGHALRFASRPAALAIARNLRRQFKVLKPYRMWAT